MTAKARWEKLNTARDGVMRRAREAAELTIPALMPPEGHNEGSDLEYPAQSLGARCVNNLSSKLTMALLPAGAPFFRLNVADDIVNLLENPTEVQEALREMENLAVKRLEASRLRVAINAIVKHLVVVGDALLYMPDGGGTKVYTLTQYCVVRDAMGDWNELIIKESVNPRTLDEGVRTQVEITVDEDSDEDVDVFTHVKRIDKEKVEWYQEINENRVDGSDGRSSYQDSPFIPLRWNYIENENYSRGHVDEHLGDIRTLNELQSALNDFAAAAAKIIFLERPNSSTDIEALNEAQSGEFVEGNPEDIATIQLDKYPDFQVTKASLDDVSLRVSHAFLLTTGTMRNAERVTAEEVRLVAQELEDVLGGVYTVLAQEMQMPIVRRLLSQMRKSGDIAALPKGTIEPTIITGFDALGRGHELNKYRQFFGDGAQLFGAEFLQQFDLRKVAQVMATNQNVEIASLLVTEEDMAAQQEQAMTNSVIDKAAAPVAGAVAQSMMQE